MPKYKHHSWDPECAMAPRRAGGGCHHRDGLRADKGSAIAQRRGDPCPQSSSSKKAKSNESDEKLT